jgi:hypothetical protein
MFKKTVAAIALALVLTMQLPAGVRANPDQKNEQQRDGQSRYEVAPYSYLPLVLANQYRLRVAMMVIMMQSWTYTLLMQPGVEQISQNRVGLGGLFGGVFGKTYGAADFLKPLEVGSIYRAGEGTVAVALKDDLRLEDYRVIVFNGDYQYDIGDRPALRQVERARLAEFGVLTMVQSMLNHTLAPDGVRMVAGFDTAADGTLVAPQLHDLPALRQLMIGKVYMGDNNTLLVVIPPTIVLDR